MHEDCENRATHEIIAALGKVLDVVLVHHSENKVGNSSVGCECKVELDLVVWAVLEVRQGPRKVEDASEDVVAGLEREDSVKRLYAATASAEIVKVAAAVLRVSSSARAPRIYY